MQELMKYHWITKTGRRPVTTCRIEWYLTPPPTNFLLNPPPPFFFLFWFNGSFACIYWWKSLIFLSKNSCECANCYLLYNFRTQTFQNHHVYGILICFRYVIIWICAEFMSLNLQSYSFVNRTTRFTTTALSQYLPFTSIPKTTRMDMWLTWYLHFKMKSWHILSVAVTSKI